ncbi:MAG: (d)CMP kinase [Puniceicoccales bacterium]|nr:(d)CMP kinase [Puniceicoccales bacterium]
MKSFTIVAIDGAAASGKTTTTKILADKYGFMRVSTGEHYRAITHKLLGMGVDPGDKSAVERALEGTKIGSKIVGNRCVITISGNQVEDKLLRSTEINEHVTQFAHIARVRKFLFDYQRSQASIAREHGFFGLAIEGRDMTSVVFPDADLRFFLHADMDKRERRRNHGMAMDPIAKRDLADEYVTLWQDGVIRIDTGFHDLQSVVNIISKYVEEL